MSSDPVELKKLVKQLQNAKTDEDIKSILSYLKKEFTVNEAILRESRAGLAVGKLRAHTSKEVSDLAKDLVKKWKNEVEKAKLQGTSSNKTVHAHAHGKAPVKKLSTHATSPTTAQKDNRTAKGDGVNTHFSGDRTRDRCIEIVYDALASDSGAPVELILSRAKAIEATILEEFDGTTAPYKSKMRSLYVNLKDKINPSLRYNVVSGDLLVERFCKMTSGEMASEERKAADNKIKEENLFNSLGAEDQQAQTDAFQCGRCKQRKCVYRQAQTRSADEPMTTFVTCTVCGNRWKFS